MEAWRRTLEPYGYAITDEDVAEVVGRPYTRTHAFLAERVALPDARGAAGRSCDRVLFELIDDAARAVCRCGRRRWRTCGRVGCALAVASSSVRERLDRTLARAGLAFEVTIAGDEVEHGKPAPDMFLLAAERLGVDSGALRRGRGLAAGGRRRARGGHADARRLPRAGHRIDALGSGPGRLHGQRATTILALATRNADTVFAP